MTKRLAKRVEKYNIERSPLYNLSNKRKLADLLGVEISKLSSLERSGLTSQYRIFTDKNTRRFITEPIGELLLIHKRLLQLFTRIAPPHYVHSAIKKRSYKTNAEKHVAAENVLKIDIKKFFPSVKFHYIHGFFLSTLKCSSDIATILAKICTIKTQKYGVHLPTGSCISPILSFLSNRRLFDSINTLCESRGCIFTLYVDDMTISGKNASRDLLTMIATKIHQYGYGYHKIQTFHGLPAIVTGLIVANGKLCLPHERAKKIRDLTDALECTVGKLRPQLLASLVGRLSEAEQINPAYKGQRQRVMSTYAAEWQQVVFDRTNKAKSKYKSNT